MAYEGTETLIAHVELPKTHRVGKYGVDVAAIDRAAAAMLAPQRRVKRTGFISEVKRRQDCELWTLTCANRDAMPQQLLAWLEPRKP